MKYGDRLKILRNKKKLSQQELADSLKINRSTYARYETSTTEPDYETLQKLADFFNVSIDYLLCRTNNPKPIEEQVERNPISIAFSHGGEELSEDEKEHLEAELKRYRELKARFMREKNKE